MHSLQFRRTRDACLADTMVDTNRMVIRLEKVDVVFNHNQNLILLIIIGVAFSNAKGQRTKNS